MFGKNVTLLVLTLLVAIALELAAPPCVCAQQLVVAQKYVVTSGHPAATAAGLAVLRAGGNVVDAAVTTSLCLGVAEPYGSGIGGKAVLIYRDGVTGQMFAITAMCAAPLQLDAIEFARLRQRERYYGYKSVGVPGLVAALAAAHERWGSRPWADLVAPSAELAERGVAITDKMYALMRPKRNLLRRDPEAARVLLDDGQTPPVGAVVRNAELGQSLRSLAAGGSRAFYEGELAERIVAAAQTAGASLTMDDFRRYRPRWSAPLDIEYDEFRVYTAPPPLTGGTTVLGVLRALDGVAAMDASDGRDPLYIDLVGRALLALYPRVTREIADVPSAPAAARALLADNSIARLQAEAAAADPATVDRRAPEKTTPAPAAAEAADASTSHLIVADRAGNIVCLTQSLSYHYGACVVVPGTGILLNDSMSNFATGDRDGANFPAPGKHERSTIAPIIVTREGMPLLALGIPGGQRIPTTTIQLLTDVLHFGTPASEAFERPRFHVRRPLTPSESANVVDLEDHAPDEFDAQLSERGWQTKRQDRSGSYFGGGSAVVYRSDGSMQGVADLRRTNSAKGD
jgi:gamma-glutamyltranspeptidase/glutathione hydrolase